MRFTLMIDVPELPDRPPPFVRLRGAFKNLLRGYGVRVTAIRPIGEQNGRCQSTNRIIGARQAQSYASDSSPQRTKSAQRRLRNAGCFPDCVPRQVAPLDCVRQLLSKIFGHAMSLSDTFRLCK